MVSSDQSERTRPAALRPGDTVGIIAPSSGFRHDDMEAGWAELLRLGYQPFSLPTIAERDLYFAGSVQRRVNELHAMFARPEIKAILCARGGYGSSYLLPHLDLDLIRANPKIFVGCSDVTTLLTWFCDAAHLVTFHGPMVAGDLARPAGFDEPSWLAALASGEGYQREFGSADVEPLREGIAEGVLYGGCLTLLCASLGTPFEIQTRGTILFIEDRGERPYRIDRMLMQLKLAGKLDGIRGVIFGEMLDCIQNANQGYTLQDVVKRIVGPLGVPVIYGLRSGHVSRENLTLPIGVQAELQVSDTRASFKILEPATTAMPSSHAARQKS